MVTWSNHSYQRICGDYKVTVNPAAKIDTTLYQELMTSWPYRVEENLLPSWTLHTHICKFHSKFETVCSDQHSKGPLQIQQITLWSGFSTSIFQRTMEGILRGIPKVCVYIDDILVTGETDQEHLSTLDKVLTRLAEADLKLKQQKCHFLKPSVEYLGYNISAEGLRPTAEKVRAMAEAPAPQNVSQLRSFLGLVNYYSRFLPQLSSLLAPLYKLLQKKSIWTWGQEQQKAFQEAKAQLTSSCLLVHFDPDRELMPHCME